MFPDSSASASLAQRGQLLCWTLDTCPQQRTLLCAGADQCIHGCDNFLMHFTICVLGCMSFPAFVYKFFQNPDSSEAGRGSY